MYTVARPSDEAVAKEDTEGKAMQTMQQSSVQGRLLPERGSSPPDRQSSDMSHNSMPVPNVEGGKVHS